MKHAVVVAHPNPDSFTLSVARTYCDAVRARGHQAELRDLYRMGFDPCLRLDEIPRPGGYSPGEDVRAERAVIGDCDLFAFVYPLWFNAPPAILKGYVDRVFALGFGYGPVAGGGNQPLLTGRKMISFTSSGAPTEWLHQDGAWGAVEKLFDRHIAAVCGLESLGHVHFGDVTPGLPKSFIEQNLRDVAEAVRRRF